VHIFSSSIACCLVGFGSAVLWSHYYFGVGAVVLVTVLQLVLSCFYEGRSLEEYFFFFKFCCSENFLWNFI
jgi:hypothetical protein